MFKCYISYSENCVDKTELNILKFKKLKPLQLNRANDTNKIHKCDGASENYCYCIII